MALNKRFTKGLHSKVARAKKSHDNTLQARIKGLKPGKRYFFRFVGRGSKSATGSFTTAPKPSQAKTVEFAWSGDQDFNSEPGQTKPYWNDGGVLRQMKKEKNAFNVMLGDTIYSDSEVPGRLNPIALSVKQKWAKYKINLKNRSLQALRGSAGFYSQWDDHEFVNDFSPKENSFDNNVNVNGSTLYKRGEQAFRDYAPVHWTKRNGLYRSFRWGKNLEVFFLDERTFRSANADEGHVCDNPQTGQPDLAPTAPPLTRARVLRRDAVARAARVAGVPRPDQQPRPDLPRQAAARGVQEGRQALDRPVQGDHERDADPAVLHPPVRPLGGLRRRARRSAPVSPATTSRT